MSRRHDIDTLRILAFGLLIIYHVGMAYVSEWNFHIKSAHQWDWLQWPMVTINRWRMPLIFMLSGIALALAGPGRKRGLGDFALRRTHRLLLPLIFGMLMIVPIQAYCEAVANGAVEPGFAAFMFRYLQLRPWPEGGFAGASHGVTWNHLWFLAYLWIYTLVLLAVLAMARNRFGARLAASRIAPGSWPGLVLIGLPTLYFFACLYWLQPRFPETHALSDDWFAHAKYLGVFMLAYLLAGDPRFWQRIERMRWLSLALAVLSITIYLLLRLAGRGHLELDWDRVPDWNWHAISRLAHALYLWAALLTILAFAQRWLNRPRHWLPRANQAVYPWYILHQSLIVPLVFVLTPLALAGWLEISLVLAGTVLGCLLIHELLIRRIQWIRPLFGQGPEKSRSGQQSS
jgi:hypothetical protein